MDGERDLARLCMEMDPILDTKTYVYCHFADFALLDGLVPICVFREREGLTAIVEKGDADRLSLPCVFEARLITLAVHSSLEAVGFLAIVTAALAQENIPCNVISAYYHDHLLVPVARADEAMALLNTLRSR